MSKLSIGHCIREARLAKGLTQQQVAEVLNVTQQAILRYERGLVNIPSQRLAELAVLFAMRPGDFYEYACPCLTLVGATAEEP